MSDLTGIAVTLTTAADEDAGTDDHVYLGIIGLGGGREFPLDDPDQDDFELEPPVRYKLGETWETVSASSGSSLTKNSLCAVAMLSCGHAQGNRDRRERRRSCSSRGDRRGSQQPAKARLAGADHLATADGCGTAAVMRRAGVLKPSVWRWQERFMAEGVDGRCTTRPDGTHSAVAKAVIEAVVTRTLDETPPAEMTHWTAPAMAAASGLSGSSAQRIWRAHGLRPHQVRRFKLSTDPKFAEKVEEIVGLYVDPPAHAVVLSIDEKSQIQALDRTQPGLPMKKGRAATMTDDYKRHGTTTLFAALNVLNGSVIGRCMQRHRHQEFIRFLNEIERTVPTGKLIHVVLDNYGAHKQAKVRHWLARHPRWIFHFTPTSCSWLNAVETFSPSSPSGGSNAASSTRSSPCRRPSTASSRPTTATQAVRLEGRSQRHHRRRQKRVPSVQFDPLGSRASPSQDKSTIRRSFPSNLSWSMPCISGSRAITPRKMTTHIG